MVALTAVLAVVLIFEGEQIPIAIPQKSGDQGSKVATQNLPLCPPVQAKDEIDLDKLLFEVDLDKVTLTDKQVRRWLARGFPQTPKDHEFLQLPPVPPAPTGKQAVRLARQLGYPNKCKARQRPEVFILGPPKSGTAFLGCCLCFAVIGNSSRKPRPMAQIRWPVPRPAIARPPEK